MITTADKVFAIYYSCITYHNSQFSTLNSQFSTLNYNLQNFFESLHRSLALYAFHHAQIRLCEVVCCAQVGAAERRELEEVERLVAVDELMVVYGEPRVSHLKLLAVVVGVILQIVAVSGEEISHADKLLVVANHLLEVRHHVYGELRSAVEAETCHLVAHGAVAEALAERLLVQFEVGVLRSGHVRSDVDIHKLAHELGDALVVHGSIHLAIAVEERRIREQRVRSVEQRELHVLERRNVVGHLCSDGLPCRATGCCRGIIANI